jgi:transposase
MTRWGDTVTLGRRDAAAIRRLLRDIGQGAVTVHRTMERRDVQAIAWLLREASQNGALPEATRQAAADLFAHLEDRIR